MDLGEWGTGNGERGIICYPLSVIRYLLSGCARAQRKHSLADVLRRCGGGERTSNANCYAARTQMARETKTRLALRIAEDAAPEIADVDWDDWRVRPFDHLFKAVAELLDPPGRREFALRIDGEQLAAAKGVARRVDGADESFGVVCRVNLDGPHEAENRSAPLPGRKDLARHHEAHRTGDNGLNNRGVDQGRVIHCQQRAALPRNVLQPFDTHVVEEPREARKEEAEGIDRKDEQRPDEAKRDEQRRRRDKSPRRKSKKIAKKRDETGGEHDGEETGGLRSAEDFTAPVGGGACLEVGVERHETKSAANSGDYKRYVEDNA